MSKTKCKKVKEGESPEVKPTHEYRCKKCGLTSRKEEKLCKPLKMDKGDPIRK
ncbi:MAG: hypothetical protein ACWA6U_11350 [Breznakibacter sp.]